MVVKIMRWRPWPPLQTRKYEVRLKVQRLEGSAVLMGNSDWLHVGADKEGGPTPGLTVEIRWKGPKIALSTFRRTTVRKNCTREENVKIEEDASPDGNAVVLVEWDEEFQSVCTLNCCKDNVFHPWEISFAVLSNGVYQGAKNKVSIVGTAVLNLAEFATKTDGDDFDLQVPLATSSCTTEHCFSLHVSLGLSELSAEQDLTETVQRSTFPVTSPLQSESTPSHEKDELSALKASLRKVKIFTEYVSTRRAKKACREEEGSEGGCSAKSEEGEYAYPFDSDSAEDFDEGESEEGKEDPSVRKSFSYGTLAYANFAGGSFYSNSRISSQDEDWIYYSNRKSDVGCSNMEDPITVVSEPSVTQTTRRSILPWRKRKLSFRSPKAKGEPLLKAYGEEGGDDIDYDRRQLSSDESLTFWWRKTDEDSSAHRSSVSEFGDDNFAVGSWEQKEILSRDGHLKLQTQVFFASIDQRSERAAGESACTALVAVIADWLQNNHDHMPIKSQFDCLIREGSLEWRNLCENESYMERFPDKHFDLDTVLQAKIRPLSVVPGKSFIGFFYPDGMEEGRFDFLHGAMSFDNIWDEISHTAPSCPSDCEPQVYIVSWNDHFFVLKVEADAYYIIDTLGERLYEGCNQAYILKFDRNTTIYKLPTTTQASEEKPAGDQQNVAVAMEPNNLNSQQVSSNECSTENCAAVGSEEPLKTEEEEVVICQGKESCKEYIKSFLAAIPIRELLADIKKGLIKSTPLHHRLQIEFHFTDSQQPRPATPRVEVGQAMPQVVEVA